MVNRKSGQIMKLSCFAAFVAAVFVFSSPAPAATSSNANSPLGINLAGISYYDSEEPFLNIFKTTAITQSTPQGWRTMDATTSETKEEAYLQLDSDGYPTTLTASSSDPNSPQKFDQVCTYLLTLPASNAGNGPPYRAGQYVILYDGVGTITATLDAQMVSTSQTSTGGRDVFNATPTVGRGVRLCITQTNPANHLRNIRVVRAANEALLDQGYIFSPTFLGLLKNFRVIRSMEWLGMDYNPTPTGNWADRTQLSNAGWGSTNGTPLEVVIDLCNALSADCWINVPDTADDNYITQMATLVHQELGPTQKVYVEFSNEVWNPAYLQFGYAEQQGAALWPSNTNVFKGNRDWYGMRVAQMCDIFANVWGSDFPPRVHCMLAAQGANPWTATEALNCPLWSGAPCYKHHITDVAIAPYFGWGPTQTPAAWNSLSQATVVDDIFSELNSGGGFLSLVSSITGQPEGPIQNVSDWEVAYQKALAPFNLPLITYEGGESLIGNPTYKTGSTIVNAFAAANADPRMAAAYTTALNDWKANGGHVYVLYSDVGPPSMYGEWGLLDSWLDTVAPLGSAPVKWQAVQNFITNSPCWWTGCTGKVAAVPMTPVGFQKSTN
jgi:hypothetical protein